MIKKPSFQFYPADYMKDPKVSMCKPATRGIWMDMLCAMHENNQSGQVVGTIEQLARICRCSVEEMNDALSDIRVTETANVTECNKIVTIVCRRMWREAKDRKDGRLRVSRHRVKQKSNEKVTPPSSSSSSSSKKANAFFTENESDNLRDIPTFEGENELIEKYMDPVRDAFNAVTLPNEWKWGEQVIIADRNGISPLEFASALKILLNDPTRKYPVTAERTLNFALDQRVKTNPPPLTPSEVWKNPYTGETWK